MKINIALLIFMLIGIFESSAQTGMKVDFDAVANNIVNNIAEVKPGETVIISGTPAEMDLLGAFYVAVSKAGGQPTIELLIPEAGKRALMEMSMEFIKPLKYDISRLQLVDCFITTGSIQDPMLYSDVPEERLAASRRANAPSLEAFYKSKCRIVSLGQNGGIPTNVYAESKGANYDEMLTMFWNAVNTDYNKIRNTGKAISEKIKPGSTIKLVTEAGTNLTFKTSELPAKISCGQTKDNVSVSGSSETWLPAGEVYSCLDPASASGTIVIPSMENSGRIIKNLRINFEKGKITGLQADKNGEFIQKSLDLGTEGKDVLSFVDIGINPASHPLKNSNYYSYEMAGIVTLGIGNNLWAGGNNSSSYAVYFFLDKATLSVDDKAIVKNGELAAVN